MGFIQDYFRRTGNISEDNTLLHTYFRADTTGCGRNSELIINKNNILLKVIDTNFFLHSFTCCVQGLSGGHHNPQCTGAHELRSCT